MTARIKICGLRDVATARATAALGADAIGLVFHEASPRHVSINTAHEIVAALPPFVSTVGLFVDADPNLVEGVLRTLPLDLLQFHGDEPPEYCRAFGRPYIKAVRVKPGLDLLELADRYADARGLLCDAYSPLAHGGTGERFDWNLLPASLPLPLILSGGPRTSMSGHGGCRALERRPALARIAAHEDDHLLCRRISAFARSGHLDLSERNREAVWT